MSAERVLRELLEACAVQHDKMQKVVEEADLLIMKAPSCEVIGLPLFEIARLASLNWSDS